jgi:GntR family transcriptional regulator
MVEEGYFVRSHGKDTVVARRKVDHHLGRLVGSVEEVLDSPGSVATIKVIHKGFEPGSASVRKHLKIAETDSTQVYSFSRAIIQDGLPLAINYSFVPYEIGRLVDQLDLSTGKVFPYLETCGYSLSWGEQEISAAICTTEFSGHLAYEPGLPLLVIRRTTFLENGYPILYEKTVYRGDRYQYSIRLQRKL